MNEITEYTDKIFEDIKHIDDNGNHYEVGNKIRKTIKDLGGTMPEELPTPTKSLKELEKENKILLIDKEF